MALVTTMTGACSASPSCTALGTGNITYWAKKYFFETTSKTGTVVVIQIINTVSNTTRISTMAKDVPPGFMPPPTNSEGTRTTKATYKRGGSWLTTAVTYPTPFVNLPTAYTIKGDYQLGSKCVRGANQAYAIPVNLQPNWRSGDTTWDLAGYYDRADDLGWSWTYLGTSNSTAPTNMTGLIGILPDDNPDMPHSVVLGCKAENPDGPYAITANPNWKVVGRKSVVYEGKTPTTPGAVAVKGNTEGTHTRAVGDGGTSSTKDGANRDGAATGTSSSLGSGQTAGSKNLGSAMVPWPLWTAAVWACSAAALCTVL